MLPVSLLHRDLPLVPRSSPLIEYRLPPASPAPSPAHHDHLRGPDVSLHSEISRLTSPGDDHRPATGSSDVESNALINVRQWIDPLVDDHGHDPRSGYVETIWLGVLGPTATWLLRRLAAGLQQHPEGFAFDLVSTAAAMGLSFRSGRSSPFTKALQRCVMFGLAHQPPTAASQCAAVFLMWPTSTSEECPTISGDCTTNGRPPRSMSMPSDEPTNSR